MGQYGSSTQSWTNSAYANAPHAHNSNNANANHNHTIDAANAPHSHTVTVDSGNAPHSHTITVSATGSASDVNIQNPYYILAYIMKY